MRSSLRNIYHAFFLILLMPLMNAAPAPAQEQENTIFQGMTVIDKGTIQDVLESDLVMLDTTKRYKLDNILVPPYQGPAVMDELKRKFLNESVTVYTYHDPGSRSDRYGVPLAHIVSDKGDWIQADLVSKGLVWAFSSEKSPQTADDLKQLEEKARAQHLGFWSNPDYAVKTSVNIKDFMDSYQIVEGRILNVYVGGKSGNVYFNFGKDWKTDFSVRISPGQFQSLSQVEDPEDGADAKRKAKTSAKNINPYAWKNRIVRVRGWVTMDNGPMMALTHKEQIDILPERK